MQELTVVGELTCHCDWLLFIDARASRSEVIRMQLIINVTLWLVAIYRRRS